MQHTEFISTYGLGDGRDHDRWEAAVKQSGELDIHVQTCFIKLLELEKQGLVKLTEEKILPSELDPKCGA